MGATVKRARYTARFGSMLCLRRPSAALRPRLPSLKSETSRNLTPLAK